MNQFDIEAIRQHSEAILQLVNESKVEQTPPTKDAQINGYPITDQFKFGKESIDKIAHLRVEMQKVILLAIRISTIDFGGFETLRSLERQKQMVAGGTSRTMKSKHLANAEGESDAFDAVPWIGGKYVWDWDGCYKIACAVDAAATHLGYADKIRWGGAWDRVLSDFGGDKTQYAKEVADYRARHGGSDFIDGPHFEWVG